MYANYMTMPAPMTMSGQYPSFTPRQEITKVNGENGARAYQLPANSSALLLDANDPIIWLVQTDGAGYKTVSCYNITPCQSVQAVDLNNLDERLKRIEALVNEPDIKSNSARKNKPAASKGDVE